MVVHTLHRQHHQLTEQLHFHLNQTRKLHIISRNHYENEVNKSEAHVDALGMDGGNQRLHGVPQLVGDAAINLCHVLRIILGSFFTISSISAMALDKENKTASPNFYNISSMALDKENKTATTLSSPFTLLWRDIKSISY